jgi:hypothetical protein
MSLGQVLLAIVVVCGVVLLIRSRKKSSYSLIRFLGRFIYQSLKLLLRIACILTGGLLTLVLYIIRDAAAYRENDEPKDYWGRHPWDYDMAGNPFPGTGYALVNRGTGEKVE